jgi:L-alanine-DL-glutamate epimerase-like enolase superfamily enzyme
MPYWGIVESLRRFAVSELLQEDAHTNRVMFNQFMAGDVIDVTQPDLCRLGGLNEALAVLQLAANLASPLHHPVEGLCEHAQHVHD